MKNDFDISVYDDRYFKWHKDFTRDYAIKTMDWFIKKYKPESIIDWGCGIGAYLESALKNGISQIKGFDIGGDFVKKYTDESVLSFIEYLDCTLPIETQLYDCVVSIETAEHIENNKSDQFVKNIVLSAKPTAYIIFTAAQPGQSGSGHINCQPKQFWIDKFLSHGFLVNEEVTKDIKENWKQLKAPDYVINNLIVFHKK